MDPSIVILTFMLAVSLLGSFLLRRKILGNLQNTAGADVGD